jgi:hypothetical protein
MTSAPWWWLVGFTLVQCASVFEKEACMKTSSLGMYSFLAATALSALSGCGAEADLAEADNLSSEQEAWAVAPCATATANATRTGKISPALLSPQTYNTCTKSYVVDLNSILPEFTGGNTAIVASWGEAVPTTQAACENLEGGAIFYKKVSGAWVAQTGQVYDTGEWVSGPSANFCLPPHAAFTGAQPGESYRIAATMRLLSGTNPTRRVRIETRIPPM